MQRNTSEKLEDVKQELKTLSHSISTADMDMYSIYGLKKLLQGASTSLDDIVRRIDVYLGMPKE